MHPPIPEPGERSQGGGKARSLPQQGKARFKIHDAQYTTLRTFCYNPAFMLLLLLLLQADDLDARLARRPLVKLECRGTPLRTALEEITKQSGVEFQVDPKIADQPVTIEETLPPFAAAEAVCRAHGGARLLFSTYARKIHVVPGTTVHPPVFDTGPFHYVVSNLLLTRSQSFDSQPGRRMALTLWLAWTDAGAPASIGSEAVITEAVDDTGRDLALKKSDFPPSSTKLLGKPVLADAVTAMFDHPAPEAKRIKSLKGYREAVFIAETRPIRAEGFDTLPVSSKGGELTVKTLVRAKTGLGALLEGKRPTGPFALPEHFQGLVFIDSDGNRYPVRVTTSVGGAEKTTFEIICPNLPESARIIACEATYVVQWKSHRIPFEFADVDLP